MMRQRTQRLLHEGLLVKREGTRIRSKTAVVVNGNRYSYTQLIEGAERLATALLARGTSRGDRIAIFMDNTWLCVVSIYGALTSGAAFMLINPQTKTDKLQFILEDSGARILLTDAHLAPVFEPTLNKLKKPPIVICSGELSGASRYDNRIETLDDVLTGSMALSTPPHVIPLDLAALIYTSGSTGDPKGVMQTHQSMVFATDSLIEYLRLTEDDRLLCVLPLAFDYGLYQLLMTIALGATLVLERSFTYPAQVFARITAERITVFPGVPTIYALLMSAHDRNALCFPTVTRVTNTAAPLPERFIGPLRKIFPSALIYRMYGLTECKRVSYLEPELLTSKPGSVGKAIPGTEVFLLSLDGNPVPPGETGILHVRGPHVMLGYWNRPELSDSMLRPGKFPGERVLCTHDYFRLDADGFLYFVGRSDDIIKTRGEKVSPVEVENVLHSIVGIREAAVIGVDDELLGQSVCAFVVLEQGVTLSGNKIRAQCASRLEDFMVPTDVLFLEELPKTESGKVSKKLLTKQMCR